MPEDVVGPRPPIRPWHAVTALDRFAIVTWAVEPDRLDAALPPALAPLTFAVGADEVALVSTVSFLDRDFRFRGAPFVRMSCGQINHRAYVRHGDRTGVWFAGTSLGHPLVRVAQVLWSLPWHREEVSIDATWDDEGRPVSMAVAADGPWGDTAIALGPAIGGTDVPAALRSPLVTDPLVGWYPRRDGRAGRYTVWHPPLPLRPATVLSARTRPFLALGVLDEDQAPLGAMACPTTTFDVHTPPRRVRADG